MKRIYFFFAALGLAFLTKGDRGLTKPIIVQGPVNQTVKLYDDVEFVCKVLASDAQIQWMKHYKVNGSFIDENGMPFLRKLQQPSDSERLNIKNVGHDDEGWYTCLVANIVGRSFQSAWLNVEDRVLTKPIIAQGPVNQTVKLYDDVEFVCKVLGSDVQIQWMKHYKVNGSFIDENGMPFLRKLQQPRHLERLNIKKVGHDDEGWYTCLVWNPVGRSYKSAWLKVEDRVLTNPIIVQGPVNQTVKLYDDVEFVCRALASDAQIQWMKHYKVNGSFTDENGVPFLQKLQQPRNSERLNIRNVGHDDEGWYTCLVANPVGRSYQSAWLSVEGNHCQGNSCGECLSSGTSCGWCADNNFNAKNHSRCQDFRNTKLKHLCSKNGVIQPVSRLTKVKKSQLSDKNMLGREKMWISLRKDGEETVRIDSRVPSTVGRKKSNVLLKIIVPTNAPLNFSLDADCYSKTIFGKSRNKLICKKQRRRSEIFFKVKLALRECITGKGKTKVKLVMKVGKQKEVAHIFVNDLCKCECVHKEKLKKCKFNGKKAIGKCYCERKPYRPGHLKFNDNPLPSLGTTNFHHARPGGNDTSHNPSVNDVKIKLPAGTRASKIRCSSCPSQCFQLKDCAACVAFEDYGGKYKTKKECLDNCNKYAITRVDTLTGDVLSQSRCKVFDSRSCLFTFIYHTRATAVNVLNEKVCQDGQIVRK